MNLEIIRTQTTWNDAAGSINSNYAKIADAIAQLKANGGGGGGGADIDLTDYATKVWIEAKGYITASALTPYALKTDIPSLVGYATEDFVNNQLGDYATKGFVNNKLTNYATTDSVTAIRNTLTGQIGAVDARAEQLATTKLDSSSFTLANIKSTLGISDWALAAIKPTYTASEVGALGVNGTAQSALKMTPEYLTDLNSATPWRFFDMNTGYGSVDGNKPNIAWVSGITGTVAGSSNYRWQLAGTTGSRNPYFRQESSGNWNGWETLAFTSDIPIKLSQLTDDVVAGKYLPLSGGTMTGDIYLGSAPSLDDPCLRKNISFIFTTGWARSLAVLAVDSKLKFHIGGYGAYYAGASDNELKGFAYIGCNNYDGLNLRITPSSIKWGDYDLIHSNNISSQSVNYATNAGSATKLLHRRKLWGNDFDGTEDIWGSINLGQQDLNVSDDTSTYRAMRLYPNYGFYIGNGTSGNYDTLLWGKNICFVSNGLTRMYVQNDGNVGIGNTSPTEKLDVAGNVKASGNINATSITINGVTITASNGSITVNGNVLATGSITAKTVG